MLIQLLLQPLNQFFRSHNAWKRLAIVTTTSALASLTLVSTQNAKADQIVAATTCMRMGYVTIEPIYMGQTVSGYEQWACADSSGINIKRPPYPVVICASYGPCKHIGWTY